MDLRKAFSSLQNLEVYCVGIKGTGMAALAELLKKRGARISGSDTEERFYTDRILRELEIPYHEGFSSGHVPLKTDIIVHSAAYDRESNPELAEGIRRNIPVITYPEALGLVSSFSDSAGIAGTHGKTTTAALCGTMISGSDLPASVLVGAAAANLGGRSTYTGGERYFIAETCEYKRHFLHFHPKVLVFTNIEEDHLDYFSGFDDLFEAFIEYGNKLPDGGTLIYCADDKGAAAAAKRLRTDRNGIELVPYGRSAEGPFAVTGLMQRAGAVDFTLARWKEPFTAHIPGEHTVLNAAAAAAVVAAIAAKENVPEEETEMIIRRGIEEFRGSSRRSELIGTAGGITFLDDYGHHPTEIRTTLGGLKKFFPGRRLIVDFMSHTFSRTQALFGEFIAAFSDADEVVFHKIYGSARERAEGNWRVSGRTLYEAARDLIPRAEYFEEVMDAKEYLLSHLREGDVFLTLGAGDNWRLGHELYKELRKKQKG